MSIVAFDHRLYCIDEKKRKPIYFELFKTIEKYTELTNALFFSPPIWKYFSTNSWKEFVKVSDFIFE